MRRPPRDVIGGMTSEKRINMAGEGKKQTKERAKEPKVDAKEATHEADAREFIQKADSQELLRIAQQTGLAAHPLVRNYDNPQAPDFHQKGDDLRRLMY